MDKKTLIALIKKCPAVFAWVTISEADGAYVKIEKKNLLLVLLTWREEDEFKAVMRDCGDLYIN